MTSPFAAHLAAADAALDAELGETVALQPMRSGDYGAMPDLERPSVDVIALVSDVESSATNIPGLELRLSYEEYQIEIDRRNMPAYKLRKNDELTLLDRPGSPRLRINRVERTDIGRMAYVCGPVAS